MTSQSKGWSASLAPPNLGPRAAPPNKEKLRLDAGFISDELGEVSITKPKDPRKKNRNKDKYVVTMETKQVRDAVKAAANLANFRETAGMRLDVPDHLQRDFSSLMNLSFDLKKKHPYLKRNVKFDEEDKSLYMDIKLKDDGDWRRVKPAQMVAANKNRRKEGAQDIGEDELKNLLESSDSE